MDQRLDDRLGIATVEQLEALGIELPRRSRVEDAAPADGRLGAENEPVASRRRERALEPELGEPAGARDPRGDVGRSEVDLRGRRKRLELVERDVEPVADRIRAPP